MVAFGGGRDIRIVVLLKKKYSFSGADNARWLGHSNTTRWLKNLNFIQLQEVGMQKLCDFPKPPTASI